MVEKNYPTKEAMIIPKLSETADQEDMFWRSIEGYTTNCRAKQIKDNFSTPHCKKYGAINRIKCPGGEK